LKLGRTDDHVLRAVLAGVQAYFLLVYLWTERYDLPGLGEFEALFTHAAGEVEAIAEAMRSGG
jgi:hypothetical protein